MKTFLVSQRIFLKMAAEELKVEAKILRPETEQYLVGLNWPGNVRQLANFCRWVTVMASSREIQINDLPPEFSAQENDSDDDGNWTHALEFLGRPSVEPRK